MTFYDAEYFVLVSRQQREREAEQYRLTHPAQAPRPSRSPRRHRSWTHLPDLSTLLHRGHHTPRTLG